MILCLLFFQQLPRGIIPDCPFLRFCTIDRWGKEYNTYIYPLKDDAVKEDDVMIVEVVAIEIRGKMVCLCVRGGDYGVFEVWYMTGVVGGLVGD